jgi:hypothetical protein
MSAETIEFAVCATTSLFATIAVIKTVLFAIAG